MDQYRTHYKQFRARVIFCTIAHLCTSRVTRCVLHVASSCGCVMDMTKRGWMSLFFSSHQKPVQSISHKAGACEKSVDIVSIFHIKP